MKVKIIRFTLLILILMFHLNFVEAQRKGSIQAAKTLSVREIANKVLPSVVLIITQDENGKPISQGSGFVFGSGLVVSNLHVFERATNAIVKNVKTGEVSKAIEVVGMNAKEDICVIRIDNTKFPILSLGNSNSAETGDEIYVASNPKGLEGSFTKGIISSLRRDVGLFQIDAAISPGSSGGVLLNQKAEAIGIIKSSLVSGQNLNFAIPINKLKALPYKFKHSIQLAGACAYRDRDKDKLKGLVKKVVEKSPHSRIENGKLIEEGIKTNSIDIYDREGNNIEHSAFNAVTGDLIWTYKFTYDENRIKTTIVDELFNGKVEQTTFDLEDGIYNKLYSREFSTTRGSPKEKLGMQIYNSSGEMFEWHTSGKIITYSYDLDGRVTDTVQTGNGKIEIKKRYRYKEDTKGNWIEQKMYSNFPTAVGVDNSEWYEGESTYREITYYE